MGSAEIKKAEDVQSCARESYDLTTLEGIRHFEANHLDPVLKELEEINQRKREGFILLTDDARYKLLTNWRKQLFRIFKKLREDHHSRFEDT